MRFFQQEQEYTRLADYTAIWGTVDTTEIEAAGYGFVNKKKYKKNEFYFENWQQKNRLTSVNL